jgi:hypothetical protein
MGVTPAFKRRELRGNFRRWLGGDDRWRLQVPVRCATGQKPGIRQAFPDKIHENT